MPKEMTNRFGSPITEATPVVLKDFYIKKVFVCCIDSINNSKVNVYEICGGCCHVYLL